MPEKLVELANWVAGEDIELSEDLDDGRINSSVSESKILEALQSRFSSVESPPPRYWYDFAFDDGKDFFPVNIKVTTTTTADNLSCKLGIYYALTGLDPEFANELRWKSYFKSLKENLATDTSSDYYFMVVNKLESSDVWIASLKTLQTLVVNGNNLPFQCRWADNRVPRERSQSDAADFILKTFGDSIKKRAQIYIDWQESFPERT